MTTTPDAQTAEAKARELLDKRIESVRSLVHARQALDDLKAKVAAAEVDDVKAYRAALSDGWSGDELRTLGLDEPAKNQRTKRRAATRKTTTVTERNARKTSGDQVAREPSEGVASTS